MSDSNNGEWSGPPVVPPVGNDDDESTEVDWGYEEPAGTWWNESRSIIWVAGAATFVVIAILVHRADDGRRLGGNRQHVAAAESGAEL